MMKRLVLYIVATVALLSFVSDSAVAQLVAEKNTAVIPAPREGGWMKRHEGFLEVTRKGGIELLFLGDSITDAWRSRGKSVWDKYYGERKAANFGISGDRTQHVLWRLENGEIEGLQPKVVVLMIGTNNSGFERNSQTPRNTTPEIIAGVTSVVKSLREKLPQSKILLLAVFPRGEKNTAIREQIAQVNRGIAKLDNRSTIEYLDIGAKFLKPDGVLPKDIMPDLLHPNEQGYQIWADAIEDTLSGMLR